MGPLNITDEKKGNQRFYLIVLNRWKDFMWGERPRWPHPVSLHWNHNTKRFWTLRMLCVRAHRECALSLLARSCWRWHNIWLQLNTFRLLRSKRVTMLQQSPLNPLFSPVSVCVSVVILWHSADRKPRCLVMLSCLTQAFLFFYLSPTYWSSGEKSKSCFRLWWWLITAPQACSRSSAYTLKLDTQHCMRSSAHTRGWCNKLK